MEIAGQMLFKQFIIKCVIMSLCLHWLQCVGKWWERPRALLWVQPQCRVCALHIWAPTKLLLLPSLLPARTHMLQTFFLLILFRLFAVFLVFQLLNFILRTYLVGGGYFHLYFWHLVFDSLGSRYCVRHVLQNSNQPWNTLGNIKIGIRAIFIHLGTVYGLLVFFSLLKHVMEPSATFKPNPPLEPFFSPLTAISGLGLAVLDIRSVIAVGFDSGCLKERKKKIS